MTPEMTSLERERESEGVDIIFDRIPETGREQQSFRDALCELQVNYVFWPFLEEPRASPDKIEP